MNNISFNGYGKGLKYAILAEHPYCAFTNKEFGRGHLRPTMDHIVPKHYKGPDRNYNYLLIGKDVNQKKGCKSLKKVCKLNSDYILNIAKYFEALSKSKNPLIQKYVPNARNTVLELLKDVSSEVRTKKQIIV